MTTRKKFGDARHVPAFVARREYYCGDGFGGPKGKLRRTMFLLPAVALLVAPGLGSALEDQLTIRYGVWDRAYRANDAKAMAAMLDPKFRVITLSGKVIPRADYVKGLGKSPAPAKYTTTLLRAEGGRYTARAWTREVSQKAGESAHVHRYRDTWKKSGGHWLLLESRTLSEETAD
jgi:hypothetical protein